MGESVEPHDPPPVSTTLRRHVVYCRTYGYATRELQSRKHLIHLSQVLTSNVCFKHYLYTKQCSNLPGLQWSGHGRAHTLCRPEMALREGLFSEDVDVIVPELQLPENSE